MPVLAAIGLATTAISAGASFVQANKQKKMMQEANAEAAKAIKEARKRLDVNVYDALTISDTPYERQREMFNAQTQQMMTGFQELGVQGMRGATAALAQGQQMQGQIADKKTQTLEGLEQMQAAEEGRLRDINVQLDLQEAEGAQLAARDAEQARQAAIEKGMKSVISAADQGAKMFELYKQDKSPKAPKAPKSTQEMITLDNTNVVQQSEGVPVLGLTDNQNSLGSLFGPDTGGLFTTPIIQQPKTP
ncbi:MAG: hypothetical protein CMI60_23730 [Parvibaculum sp.]|nr:hypothetical protein [Parvibaculum sp.]|tara:strand:+ start:369 stop:1112 length:744 start_codon:yes stop_codon:yes gene_type:complete